MITAPCRVCGINIQRDSLDALLCGPACEALHTAREAARARGAKPGDHDYYPVNNVQRSAHKRAMRAKARA